MTIEQIDITLSVHRGGRVHLRVMASKAEDWSGWYDDWDSAVKAAVARRDDILERERTGGLWR